MIEENNGRSKIKFEIGEILSNVKQSIQNSLYCTKSLMRIRKEEKMREILFRGKRLDNKEWVFGSLVKMGPTDYVHYYILPNYASSFYDIEIDPITIGEYIGRTDKMDKMIFEGDIIKIKDWYDEEGYHEFVVGNVVFENGEWHIKGNVNADFSAFEYSWDTEIIGNIYDDTELLNFQ